MRFAHQQTIGKPQTLGSGACIAPELIIGFEVDPRIDYFFNGALDDVRFYDGALSSGDVTGLFNDSPTAPPPPRACSAWAWTDAGGVTLGSTFRPRSR